MATGKKGACQLNAGLVFLDESGVLMAPLVRRTWAPRGRTPLLRQRTRSHQKVSVIAALCVAPNRQRVSLFFRLHPDENVSATHVVDFLRQLRRHLRWPIVLLWDRLQAHRARATVAFLQARPKLQTHFLPAYAPELNPVEQVWSYLKMNPLANLVAKDLNTLAGVTRKSAKSLQRKHNLLRSFVHHCPLPIPLE